MSIKKDLQKGALVNFIGVVGKVAGPAFLILVTRLYGPDLYGIFVTANLLIEISIAFLTSGFKDASLIFVARYADREEDRPMLYRSMANAFAWSVGFAVILVLITLTLISYILALVYPPDFAGQLTSLLMIMVLTLPFMAFERMTLSATQGLKIMKYEAMVSGWIRPLTLLGFVAVFYLFHPGLYGLGFAYIMTQSVILVIAIWVYQREFSWKSLYEAITGFRLNRELVKFAIPQNFNLTLTRFITGLDVLMLPAFGFSAAMVGFYAAGSMIVRELRNIKLMFSTALAPYIVRFHQAGDREGLSRHFSMSANWVASLAIPVILALAILKEDILFLVHPDFTDDTLFMLFLLPVPYLYNCFGLAGNIVTMSGYSNLTLMNSSIVVALNIVLNFLLIPLFGLVGAALASAISVLLLAVLEILEARYIIGARLIISKIFLPHLLGLIMIAVLTGLHSTTGLFESGPLLRLLVTGVMIALYAGILFLVHRAGRYKIYRVS